MDAVEGVDADLDVLFAEVAALRALAGDRFRSDDPGSVYDLSIGWGTMMSGRLPRLAYYLDHGALTDGEHRRYSALLAELADVADLVERFGLLRPVTR